MNERHVAGWDDPRMPTISGLRRRGYTPEAIRRFADDIGVAKRENVVDIGLLEFFVREDLNKRAPRAMAVLRPLKIVLENYPDGETEDMDVVNNPEDPSAGTRRVPFSKRAVTSSTTTSARIRRRSSSVLRPAARYACATRTSSRAARS